MDEAQIYISYELDLQLAREKASRDLHHHDYILEVGIGKPRFSSWMTSTLTWFFL